MAADHQSKHWVFEKNAPKERSADGRVFLPAKAVRKLLYLTDVEMLAIMTKSDERIGHCELNVLADLPRNNLMACAMCIISNCKAEFNLWGGWKCRGDGLPVCPECQTPMKNRDSRLRPSGRKAEHSFGGRIRCLFCKNCHRLYNELPIILCPYKHYEVEVIEGVVDEVISPDDLESEDYPCARTIERWKQWIEYNRPFIEGYIRSVGFRLLNLGVEFLKARESMLDYLRDKFRDRENHWLTIVNRLVYNTGASLKPLPPPCPLRGMHLLCFADKR